MKYVLENPSECERLEKQSQQASFDFKKELHDFTASPGEMILDAGCGPGTVLRHLAVKYPSTEFHGCDAEPSRIQFAKEQASGIQNLEFNVEDIRDLRYADSRFHQILCRYVIEHLSVNDRMSAFQEFFRCLLPGGKLTIIDVDGFLFNLYPRTPAIDHLLKKLEASAKIDLFIGRKLPHLLTQCGFENVNWEIQTVQFTGDHLANEIEMLNQRLDHATPFLLSLVNGVSWKVEEFRQDYIRVLNEPGTVLFNNMFIATAKKTHSGRLRLIK